MGTYKYIYMHKYLDIRALIKEDSHWLGSELQENEAYFLLSVYNNVSWLCNDKWHVEDAKGPMTPFPHTDKTSINPRAFYPAEMHFALEA